MYALKSRRFAIAVLLLCNARALAQQQVLIISEMDTAPPQGVHILDSLPQVIDITTDAVYSGHLFSNFTYNGNAWIAFSTLDDSTARLCQTSYNQPDKLASVAWSSGLQVTDISFGDDAWLLYATENTGVEQVVIFTGEFNKLPELISKYWAQGFVVTETAFGRGSWGLVLSRPKKKRANHPLAGLNQVYSTLMGDFEKLQQKVEDRWDQGYAITSLASNGSLWLIIGSQVPEIISQRIILSENEEDLAQVMYSVRQQNLMVTECVGLRQP